MAWEKPNYRIQRRPPNSSLLKVYQICINLYNIILCPSPCSLISIKRLDTRQSRIDGCVDCWQASAPWLWWLMINDDFVSAHMKTILYMCAHTVTHCHANIHITSSCAIYVSPILISTVSNWTSAQERNGKYCSRLHSDLSDGMQSLELMLTDAARQAEPYASGTASWLFVFLACGSQQMVEHLQLGPVQSRVDATD